MTYIVQSEEFCSAENIAQENGQASRQQVQYQLLYFCSKLPKFGCKGWLGNAEQVEADEHYDS
jgi:hypothetical protein